MNATDETLCGARRRGWERPGPGRHRLPCIRDIGHDQDHLDAFGQTWPRCCSDCGTTDGPLEGNTTAEADGTFWDGHLCRPCLEAATAPDPEELEQPGIPDLAALVADLAALVETAAAIDEAQLLERVLEPEIQALEQPVVRVPVRMCVRCYTITDTPVVVSEVHANSGPGFNVYACSECAPHFPPVQSALDLLPLRRSER